MDVCKTLAHALITYRLYYGNALLCSLLSTLMTRLQKVQNSSARLVNCTHKIEHITPVLNSLHWILMYTFKALQGTSPQYLEEFVLPYQPTRFLRSDSGAFLAVPTTRGVSYGNRCFRKGAATLWNNLPVTIRKCKTLDTFKKKIKTYLFVSAFPS